MNPCHCAGSGECSGPWEVCDVLPEEYNLLAVSSATTLAEVRRLALWALDGVSLYLQCGADRDLIESTKAYVDQTRHAIRKATPASALPPPNSDRLREIAERAKGDAAIDPLECADDRAFLLSEINKLKAEKAETIEVLERYPVNGWQYEHRAWHKNHGKPLLDKLKGES